MKLKKTTAAIIIAGSIGIAALTAPLIAHSGKSCEQRQHRSGHFSMMNGHGPMNKNPEKMIEMMSHKLDLSDEQRDQAFTKLDDFRPQMQQAHQAISDGMKRIHEIDSGSDDFRSNLNELADQQGKLVAQAIKLHTTMHVEFEELLTAEQKLKLKEMQQKHGNHHGRKHAKAEI